MENQSVRKRILNLADQAIKGNWWRMIGVGILSIIEAISMALLFSILPIIGIVSAFFSESMDPIWKPICGIAIYFIVLVTFLIASLSYTYYCYKLYRRENKLSQIFYMFKNSKLSFKFSIIILEFAIIGIFLYFIASFIGMILIQGNLRLMALATLLPLVVFSIFYLYVCINYCLMTYVLFDNPNMKINQVLKTSKNLIKGKRWGYVLANLTLMWVPIAILVIGLIVYFIMVSNAMSTFDVETMQKAQAIYNIFNVIYYISLIIVYPKLTMVPIACYNMSKDENNMPSEFTSPFQAPYGDQMQNRYTNQPMNQNPYGDQMQNGYTNQPMNQNPYGDQMQNGYTNQPMNQNPYANQMQNGYTNQPMNQNPYANQMQNGYTNQPMNQNPYSNQMQNGYTNQPMNQNLYSDQMQNESDELVSAPDISDQEH